MIYGWQFVALYFISALVVPLIFMSFWVANDRRFDIVCGDDIFLAVIFCLFWPVVMPITLYEVIKKARRIAAVERCKRIVSARNFERLSPHDRSAMIGVPEKELKFVLKHHRRGNIELSKQLLEMVRDELMNREAERGLLGTKTDKEEVVV